MNYFKHIPYFVILQAVMLSACAVHDPQDEGMIASKASKYISCAERTCRELGKRGADIYYSYDSYPKECMLEHAAMATTIGSLRRFVATRDAEASEFRRLAAQACGAAHIQGLSQYCEALRSEIQSRNEAGAPADDEENLYSERCAENAR